MAQISQFCSTELGIDITHQSKISSAMHFLAGLLTIISAKAASRLIEGGPVASRYQQLYGNHQYPRL
jgi:hypothetical protein